MSIQVKDIPKKILPILDEAMHYSVFIFILLSLGLMGYLVFRVNQLSRLEPTEDAVTEKLETIPRPRVDENIVKKIEKLRDQNVKVETLFEEARNNPFAEKP
jgi:hypothetical protein